jgi:rare lipoprotein A
MQKSRSYNFLSQYWKTKQASLKLFFGYLFISCLAISMTSCSTTTKKNDSDYYLRSKVISEKWEKKAEINKKYTGHYKVGKPYEIKKKKYYPKKVNKHTEVGIASWYRCDYNFKYCLTANQDVFHQDVLSAAHKTLPMPSMVKIVNLENKKSLIVMVNDRGPFKPNRIIDVSEKAATLLGFRNKGLAKVRIEYLDQETKKLHQKLSLPPVENKYSTDEITNKKCGIKKYINSVNIHNKLINDTDIKHDPKCIN